MWQKEEKTNFQRRESDGIDSIQNGLQFLTNISTWIKSEKFICISHLNLLTKHLAHEKSSKGKNRQNNKQITSFIVNSHVMA